ncbi:MAG: Gfo/Idh/MocA family oxidoreductase [Acidobacteriota bacterium]
MGTNRRDFLKTGAVAATALSWGRILGANERIRLGAIGTGARCQYLLGLLKRLNRTDLVAVCDVYGPRRAEAKEKFGATADEYVDHRELLDRKDLDAVIIAVPDHWHVPITVDAVQAGKDIYLEKPVTHTIAEGQRLLDAVENSDRVVQTGTQQRSWPHFIEARERIRSGEIGTITLVKTFWYQSYLERGDVSGRTVDQNQLDWKRFLGSAPQQPFNAERFFNWRWFWDFGGGALTDLFTHWVDVAHWYMGQDLPIAVQGMGDVHVLHDLECPDTVSAALRYPGNFTVQYTGTMIGSLEGGGLIFRGTKGMLELYRAGYSLYAEHARYNEDPSKDKPYAEVKSQGDGAVQHLGNFLDCMASRKKPNAPVDVGITAARAGHLANQAIRSEAWVRT